MAPVSRVPPHNIVESNECIHLHKNKHVRTNCNNNNDYIVKSSDDNHNKINIEFVSK